MAFGEDGALPPPAPTPIPAPSPSSIQAATPVMSSPLRRPELLESPPGERLPQQQPSSAAAAAAALLLESPQSPLLSPDTQRLLDERLRKLPGWVASTLDNFSPVSQLLSPPQMSGGAAAAAADPWGALQQDQGPSPNPSELSTSRTPLHGHGTANGTANGAGVVSAPNRLIEASRGNISFSTIGIDGVDEVEEMRAFVFRNAKLAGMSDEDAFAEAEFYANTQHNILYGVKDIVKESETNIIGNQTLEFGELKSLLHIMQQKLDRVEGVTGVVVQDLMGINIKERLDGAPDQASAIASLAVEAKESVARSEKPAPSTEDVAGPGSAAASDVETNRPAMTLPPRPPRGPHRRNGPPSFASAADGDDDSVASTGSRSGVMRRAGPPGREKLLVTKLERLNEDYSAQPPDHILDRGSNHAPEELDEFPTPRLVLPPFVLADSPASDAPTELSIYRAEPTPTPTSSRTSTEGDTAAPVAAHGTSVNMGDDEDPDRAPTSPRALTAFEAPIDPTASPATAVNASIVAFVENGSDAPVRSVAGPASTTASPGAVVASVEDASFIAATTDDDEQADGADLSVTVLATTTETLAHPAIERKSPFTVAAAATSARTDSATSPGADAEEAGPPDTVENRRTNDENAGVVVMKSKQPPSTALTSLSNVSADWLHKQMRSKSIKELKGGLTTAMEELEKVKLEADLNKIVGWLETIGSMFNSADGLGPRALLICLLENNESALQLLLSCYDDPRSTICLSASATMEEQLRMVHRSPRPTDKAGLRDVSRILVLVICAASKLCGKDLTFAREGAKILQMAAFVCRDHNYLKGIDAIMLECSDTKGTKPKPIRRMIALSLAVHTVLKGSDPHASLVDVKKKGNNVADAVKTCIEHGNETVRDNGMAALATLAMSTEFKNLATAAFKRLSLPFRERVRRSGLRFE